jgi:uncharacterized repeat protein (TIGR01451 family)
MNKQLPTLIFTLFISFSCLAQFSLQQSLGYAMEEVSGFRVADLNGDDLPDLVAYGNENNRKVVCQMQLGPATFSLPVLIADELPFVKALELADMDADGDLDILLLPDAPAELIWFENQGGSGRFSSGRHYALPGDLMETWLVEDFNLDGAADLVFHSFFNRGTSFLMMNDGFGGFSNAVEVAVNEQPLRNQHFATYDWNQDTYPDLFIATSEVQNDVEVYAFDPQAQSFSSPEVLLSDISEPRLINVNDLDENGEPDILLYHRRDRNNFQLVRFFRENETDVWQRDTFDIDEGLSNVNFIQIIDLEEDGEKDVIIGTPGFSFQNGLFYAKQQNGQFSGLDTLQRQPAKSSFYALEDFNRDGKVDLLLGSEAGLYYSLFSEEKMEWEAVQPIPVHMFRWNMEVGDMDRDGDRDILATSSRQGFIAIIQNNQAFDRIHVIESGLSQADRSFPMDIDQDGDQDFLYVKSSGFSDGGFWLYRNDGAGNYTSELVDRELVGADYVRAVDLDGDKDLDLVTASAFWTGIFYYMNEDGLGNLGERRVLSLPARPIDVDMADWDKDGDEDLLMTLSSDDRIQLSRWENGQFAEPELLRRVQGFWAWRDFAILDVDQDDYPDAISFDGAGNILYHLNTEKDSSEFFDWAFLFVHREAEVNRVLAVDIDHDGQKDILAATELNGLQDSLLWIPAPFDSTIQSRAVFQYPPAGIIYQAQPIDRDARPDLIIHNLEREDFSWWKNETGAPTIVAITFYDQNANGKRDQGELLLRDIPVVVSPSEQLRFSKKDGAIVFFLSDGAYTAEVQYPAIFRPTTASSFTFTAGATSRPDTLLFGLEAIEPLAAVEVSGLASRARCNESGYIDIQLKNAGTLPLSGEVQLITEPPWSINWAENGEPLTDPQEASWLIDDLTITESIPLRAYLDPVSTEFIGDTLQAMVLVKVMGPNGQMGTDSFQIFTPLFCSYDPNDKLVQTARAKADLIEPGEELFYTIRFQNTGNDTAFQVILRDPLPEELDWSSLQPVNASHEFDVLLDQSGLLEVRFSDIALVDSLTNPEGSQGFFQFSIKSLKGLQIGDLIQNQAAIYFDGNPPIFTNTVVSQIKGTVDTDESFTLSNGKIKVFPNPTQGDIRVEWTFDSAVEVQLLNVHGQVLKSARPGQGRQQLQWNLGQWPKGLYLIRIRSHGRKGIGSKWIVLK